MGLERDYTANGAVRIEFLRCWTWHDDKNRWHRVNGPAAIYDNGRQEWLLHGKYHRVDGPAIIHADGSQEWRLHGKFHRVDGPAVIHATGEHEWHLHDRNITDEVKSWMQAHNITWPFTDEQLMEFALRWS